MSKSKAASAPALRVIHGTGCQKAASLEDLRGVIDTMRVARKNGIDLRVQMHVGAATVDLNNAEREPEPTPVALAKVVARFVNLDDNGKPDAKGNWVFDRTTRLVWARKVLEGEYTFADALKACEKVKFMGQACRAPTLQERFSINDYTKHSPALDTAHFAKESGWEWTSTVDASSPSDYAWLVLLGAGNCNRSSQSNRYRVRPVLAGQLLSLDL